MKLHILGTSSAVPTHKRNLPAILLQRDGELMLFDCGDGTQLHVERSPFKMTQISKILISHLHGDHVYGLPGLLASIYFKHPEVDLSVFGPKKLESMFAMMNIFENKYPPPFYITEEGIIFESDEYSIVCAELSHKLPCMGFALIEKDSTNLDVSKLTAKGLAPGPIYKELKEKGSINFGNEILKLEDFSTIKKGKKIAYCTDTRLCKNIYSLARDADILICESTFKEGEEEMAREYGHMTSMQAIKIAKKCNVGKLVLTHFSSRHPFMEDQLSDCDLEIILAKEGNTIDI